MPAVAVKRQEPVLFIVIGRKGFVDGLCNILLKDHDVIVVSGIRLINYESGGD